VNGMSPGDRSTASDACLGDVASVNEFVGADVPESPPRRRWDERAARIANRHNKTTRAIQENP
jgi:hypothetical protein